MNNKLENQAFCIVSGSTIIENELCSLFFGQKPPSSNQSRVLESVHLQGGSYPSYIAVNNATSRLEILRALYTYGDDGLTVTVFCWKFLANTDQLKVFAPSDARQAQTRDNCMEDRLLYNIDYADMSETMYLVVRIQQANGTELGDVVVEMGHWDICTVKLLNTSISLAAYDDRKDRPVCLFLFKVSFRIKVDKRKVGKNCSRSLVSEFASFVTFLALLMQMVSSE